MKSTVINIKDNKEKEIELPGSIFNEPLNKDLLYQVIRIYQLNKRQPTAFTKDRSEVRGGGRKPWKQKGTGRARHGSIRSPLWKGGGVTFGPRAKETSIKRKVNKKVRQKALAIILSQKLKDQEIKIVDTLKIDVPKTKEMNNVLKTIFPNRKKEKILFILKDQNENIKRGARNIPGVNYCLVTDLNPLALVQVKYLVFTQAALDDLSRFLNKDKTR